MVAAITRTSTLISLSAPTLVIFPSCNARSTLAWAFRLISPISSRNKVPPLACSNFPIRCLMAEVKDPFSCPNNSLSISSVGIAAQFTSTNGPVARLLFSCTQRATSSLPTPLSPVISILASVGATFSIVSFIFCIGAEPPIISCTRLTFLFSTLVSVTRLLRSMALRIVIKSLLRSGGFEIKS